MRRPDVQSLVAGLVVIAFGVLLLLDRADQLDLEPSAFGPIACAGVGVILLASGLSRRA